MRAIDHPAMVKHGIGWAAMNGIVSATLAASGFTGIPSLFGLVQYRDWVSDIGVHYHARRHRLEALRLGNALPSTTEEAQFNMAWPLAVFLLDGEVGPAQMLEHRLGDARVRDLASRVELAENAQLNALCKLADAGDPRGRLANIVRITLRDGRSFDSGLVEGEISYPQRCWDERSLEKKFRRLAGYALDTARVDALVEMLWRFETVDEVRELAAIIM